MEKDPFLELLIKNNESEIRDFIKSNGKRAKPVSPIYFFSDLSDDDLIKEQEKYNK